MGIHNRLDSGEQIQFRENTYVKLEKAATEKWGARGKILSLGKSIDKVKFYPIPHKIYSSKHQIKLLYNWLLECEDRRTRVVGKAYMEEENYTNTLQSIFDGFEVDETALRKSFKQKFYQYQAALDIMNRITEGRESHYVLTNPVYAKPHEIVNNSGRRTTQRLTEMHVLYCEIDQYSDKAEEQYRNLSSRQVWKKVKKKIIDSGFPLPTEVVYSRGLQIWWKHGPIPAYMIDEWKLMMKCINQMLSEFGADPAAMDAVRILRAVSSIHEKTGEKIEGLTFTNDRYDFMQMFNTYCSVEWSNYLLKLQRERRKRAKELEKRWTEKHKWMRENGIIDEHGEFTEKYDPNKKQKRKRLSEKAKKHYYTNRHKNIIDGVFWLTNHVRHGHMTGCREFSCYLVYAMMLRITGGNTIESLRVVQDLFDSFVANEYQWQEMLSRIRSAEMDYKRWLLNDTTGIKYLTQTLIDELHITQEEMKKMRFIVTPERSAELQAEYMKTYNKTYYKKQLKAQNKMTKKEEKEYRAELIKNYLKEDPGITQKELAHKLGVTDRTIRNLIKEFEI